MTGKEYYRILGVERSADDAEIKHAFRKLAKKYHPDTNADDPAAEQRFKEINEAYAILGDPKKRQLYDKYGDIAFQEGFDPEVYEAYRNSGFGNGGFSRSGSYRYSADLNDLFSDLFGHTGYDGTGSTGGTDHAGHESRSGRYTHVGKGSDLHSEITISFEDAVSGCDRTIHLSDSNGSTQSLQVHIPAGIDEGQKVRLKGQGHPGVYGGSSGDLFLKVHIAPKKGYERKGSNLYVTAQIPFTTAVLGGEAIVPILDSRIACKIPAGIQSGSKIRLKGRGIVSMKNPSVRGDAYVIVQIDVPKHLTEEQKQKLREFEELLARKGGKNPRAA